MGCTVGGLEADDLVLDGEDLLQPVRHALVQFLAGADVDPLAV